MILRVYGNGLCGLVEVWGVLGYFGVVWGFSMHRTTVMLTVKSKSNSQTSLPRAIDSPIDSRTVLLRPVG